MNIISGSYGLPQLCKRVNLSADKIDHLNHIHQHPGTQVKICNEYMGIDPCPGIQKSLYLNVKINDELVEIEYPENHYFSSIVDFSSSKNDFEFYDLLEPNLFNQMLRAIVFADEFYDIVSSIQKQLNLNLEQKLVVVHLRLEDDALCHWSKQNKLTLDDFQQKLINLYTEALEHNVNSQTDLLMVLSNEPQKMNQFFPQYKCVPSIKELKDCLLKDKLGSTGRELAAIIDLLLASQLGSTFIGCHNLELKRGSTFSYNILQNVKPGNKICLIDLDDVNLPVKSSIKH